MYNKAVELAYIECNTESGAFYADPDIPLDKRMQEKVDKANKIFADDSNYADYESKEMIKSNTLQAPTGFEKL